MVNSFWEMGGDSCNIVSGNLAGFNFSFFPLISSAFSISDNSVVAFFTPLLLLSTLLGIKKIKIKI